MRTQTAPHDDCQGTGHLPHPQAGQSYTCTSCNGHGATKRSGYGGYTSKARATAALAKRTARPCSRCEGTGRATYPATQPCYGCTEGITLTAALPGWTWDAPRALRFSRMRGDVGQGYALSVKIQVVAQDRSGTFNEAYLGLGAISSVTDYGRSWDSLCAAATAGDISPARKALEAAVRDELFRHGTQWLNVITPDDTLATTIRVLVHRNGYTINAANPAIPVLPPTYTRELLNAPV